MAVIIKWDIDDSRLRGTGGGFTVRIEDYEFDRCDTEEERQAVIDDAVDADFQNNVRYYIASQEEV